MYTIAASIRRYVVRVRGEQYIAESHEAGAGKEDCQSRNERDLLSVPSVLAMPSKSSTKALPNNFTLIIDHSE